MTKKAKRHMGHWSKNRVQIRTAEKRRRCAECKRVRLLKYFLTSSKNLTRVCDQCRDEHGVKVAIKVSTAINAPSMDDMAECEKCGQIMILRLISAHRKTCILGRLYDIPGIRPPGQAVEDEPAA